VTAPVVSARSISASIGIPNKKTRGKKV
jgi:hypothetical protein